MWGTTGGTLRDSGSESVEYIGRATQETPRDSGAASVGHIGERGSEKRMALKS